MLTTETSITFMLQIYCKNINKSKSFPKGISLLDIYFGFGLNIPFGPVSAKVNNKVESLTFQVYNNKDVEFQNIQSSSGMRTYVRSLCFILCKAVEDLYPNGNIVLEHPISKGYYCQLRLDRSIGLDDVKRIKQRMKEIIAEDIPFQRFENEKNPPCIRPAVHTAAGRHPLPRRPCRTGPGDHRRRRPAYGRRQRRAAL